MNNKIRIGCFALLIGLVLLVISSLYYLDFSREKFARRTYTVGSISDKKDSIAYQLFLKAEELSPDNPIPPGYEYYGYIPGELTTPVNYFLMPDIDLHDLDPQGVEINETLYSHNRAADVSGKPTISIKGAPFKYATDGKKYFLIISNGPDRDRDFNKYHFSMINKLSDIKDIWQYLEENGLFYDLERGSGDIMQIEEIDYNKIQNSSEEHIKKLEFRRKLKSDPNMRQLQF